MTRFDDLLAEEKRKWTKQHRSENKGMSTTSALIITFILMIVLVKAVFIFVEPKIEGITEYWDETKHPNGVITREKKYTITPNSGGIILKKPNQSQD